MDLKIILLNCQDFYIFMDKYNGEDLNSLSAPKWQLLSTSFYPNKDLEKVVKIANLFLNHEPDIIMLTEVGGKESLENFNTYFLNDQYNVLLEASNSERGIDLGYLVNKKLKLKTTLISHTDAILENGKKFARGVFELRLLKNNKPVFINFLCHLKSKLDFKRVDFEGRGQRVCEVKYIKKLYQKASTEYPNIPICISGDLNAIIYKSDTEPELNTLVKDSDLEDVFEQLSKPLNERISYCYFDKKQDRFDMQLDYILLSKRFKGLIYAEDTYVLNFDSTGDISYPKTLKEKLAQPSDHYPIHCKIRLNT